jgi:hypothetical protein
MVEPLSARVGIARPAAAAVPAARTRVRRVRGFICASCADVGGRRLPQLIYIIKFFML